MELVNIRNKEGDEIHDALIALLRLNREGRIRGLAFGLALDDGDYRIGIKGSSRRHPMEALALFARGTSTANNLVSEHLEQFAPNDP
ncbi:hypothetical protein [Cupriavidus plantarum]|uniref:hypothetical protein n=1 Tax=Cupriavidus plantarum TaxID=942865 RepID=UPI0011C3511E|nr:hypothetical protein [Cupriavidus plantarum]